MLAQFLLLVLLFPYSGYNKGIEMKPKTQQKHYSVNLNVSGEVNTENSCK